MTAPIGGAPPAVRPGTAAFPVRPGIPAPPGVPASLRVALDLPHYPQTVPEPGADKPEVVVAVGNSEDGVGVGIPQAGQAALLFDSAMLCRTAADLCLLAQVGPLQLEVEGKSSAHFQQVAESAPMILTDNASLVPEPLAHLPRIVVGDRSAAAVVGKPVGEDRIGEDQIGEVQGASRGGSEPDIWLPGDEVSLIHLLEQWSGDESHQRQVVLVAGWHGGAGATTTAWRMAQNMSAVLLDSSGNYGMQDLMYGGHLTADGRLDWADLDPADLPSGAELVSALPRLGGTPVLTALDSMPVTPDKGVVEAVAAGVPRDVVIDCGTAVGSALRLRGDLELLGLNVHVFLVGRATADSQGALARTLMEFTSGPEVAGDGEQSEAAKDVLADVTVLLVRRPSDIFRAVVSRFPVSWFRAPRPTAARRWRKLLQRTSCLPSVAVQ